MYYAYFFVFIVVSLISFYIYKRVTFNVFIHMPIIIVSALYTILGAALEFKEINEFIYVFFTIFLCLGALTEWLIYGFLQINYDNKHPLAYSYCVPKKFVVFINIISLIILCSAYYFSRLYPITSDEFESKMGSGIIGHSLVFLMITPVFIYLAYRNNKISKWHFLLSIIIIFVCLFLKQVKSWILIPMIYFYLIVIYYNYNLNKMKLALHALFIVSLMLCIFFSVYILRAIVNGDSQQITTLLGPIAQHFFFYFFSGILAFSEYINANLNISYDRWYLFILPVVNILNLIMGQELLSAVNPLSYPINNQYKNISNVYTMFGTLWMSMGYYSLLYYTALVSLMSVLSLKKSATTSNHIYLYISSFGFFSWFEYYYYHLTVFEGTVYILTLSILFRVKTNAKQNINHSSELERY